MTIIEITLTAATVFLLAWLIIHSLKANRQHKRLQKQIAHQQKQIKALHHELQTMVSTTVGVGKRVRLLGEQMQDLSLRQEEIELSGDTTKPIEQAIALAKRGASVSELVQTCDLSQGEAELLLMVHRSNDAFPNP